VKNSRVEVRPDRRFLLQQLKAVEARVMAIQAKKRKLDSKMARLTDGIKVCWACAGRVLVWRVPSWCACVCASLEVSAARMMGGGGAPAPPGALCAAWRCRKTSGVQHARRSCCSVSHTAEV
jgi:hypothetical protein